MNFSEEGKGMEKRTKKTVYFSAILFLKQNPVSKNKKNETY